MMEIFDLSNLIKESLEYPELKLKDNSMKRCPEYDRYLSGTSTKYSIIYDKKEKRLVTADIKTKRTDIKKDIPIEIENIAISEDFLIIFSEKKFYVLEIAELLATELPFTDDNGYKSEFSKIEKIISNPSTPDFIYYLVKDNNTIYKQKINPFEDPIEVFSDVSTFSVTENQIIISQLDGIHVYEFTDSDLNQITSIPVVDPIFISGGKNMYSVITNHSFTTYNLIGDITYESESIPLNICEHSCSTTFYYENRVIFTEPYQGEMTLNAVAGGIVGDFFYFWKKNLEFKFANIPAPKINYHIKIKHREHYNANNNNKNQKNPPKKQNQKNQKNQPQKQDQKPPEPPKKKKKSEKTSVQATEIQTFPVTEKFFIMEIKNGAISKKNLENGLMKEDRPMFSIHIPSLNMDFFGIKSIHSDHDIIAKLKTTIPEIWDVRAVEMHESLDDFYIISSISPPFHEKTIRTISENFKLRMEPILNVFHCIPSEEAKRSKYVFSFLNNLEVNGKIIRLYKNYQDVPVVFSYNLNKTTIDKTKQLFPDIFSNLVDTYKYNENHSFIFSTIDAAKELCKHNFEKINSRQVWFIRFTPVMWNEKPLHVHVSGNIKEDQLYLELHQSNQNVIHVFRDGDHNVVVYLNPKAAEQGRKEFSQGRKIKNQQITILN